MIVNRPRVHFSNLQQQQDNNTTNNHNLENPKLNEIIKKQSNPQYSVKKFKSSYQILQILGQGSYGQVAAVRHRLTHKKFAMKLYMVDKLQKLKKLKSLLRSMKLLSTLENQNIIKVYGYAYDEQIFVILQELCEEGNLESFLKSNISYLNENLKKLLIIQITQILAYLEKQEIAHRDIKPSNFVLNSQGQLKLIDFDQALSFKESTDGSSQKLSRSRNASFVGTESYLAPELQQYNTYTEKGDVWSLGCIIFGIFKSRLLCHQEALMIQEQLIRNKNLIIKNSSEQGYNLLTAILKNDPLQRLSASAILQHQYLRDLTQNTKNRFEIQKQLIKLMKESKQKILVQKRFIINDILDSKFKSFRFNISGPKLCIMILKKSTFFFYPKVLICSYQYMRILDENASHTEVFLLQQSKQFIIVIQYRQSCQIIQSQQCNNRKSIQQKYNFLNKQHIKTLFNQILYENLIRFYKAFS